MGSLSEPGQNWNPGLGSHSLELPLGQEVSESSRKGQLCSLNRITLESFPVAQATLSLRLYVGTLHKV